MARKYAYLNNTRFGWAMEECEEKVLIACYEDVRNRIPENTFWKLDFEDHFYRHGSGVADNYLQKINAECRRLNHPLNEIVETNVSDYGKSFDKAFKVVRRLGWMMAYREMDKAQKQRFRLDAEADVSRLMPAFRTLESRLLLAGNFPSDTLSVRERDLRMQAVETKRIETEVVTQRMESETRSLLIDRALRQLGLSSSPAVKAKIIAKQTPEDALTLAEIVEDAELKDALVARSLEDC